MAKITVQDFVQREHPNLDENLIVSAVTGSLRELLVGASAQPESAILEIIGIPYNHAVLLLAQLSVK